MMRTLFKFFFASLGCLISAAYADSYIINKVNNYVIDFYTSEKQLIGTLQPNSQGSFALPTYYKLYQKGLNAPVSYDRFPYNYDGVFSFPQPGGYPDVLYPYGGFILQTTGAYKVYVKAGKTEKTVSFSEGLLGYVVVFTPGEIGSTGSFDVVITIVGKIGKNQYTLVCDPAPSYYDAGYKIATLSGTVDFPKINNGTSCLNK